MKVLKLKRFITWVVAIVLALIVSALVASVNGVRDSGVAAAAEEKPKIVLLSNPAHLNKDDPYQEFTVTVRIEDVAKVDGGMFGGTVLITPTEAGILDFIEFIESTDVVQSKTLRGSKHNQGISVLMEGMDGNAPITEDFNIGSFKFKLKESVTDIPSSISFTYQDRGCVGYSKPTEGLKLASGTFTVNYVEPEELEDINTLSALTLSVGNTPLLSGTGASQTVSAPIAYSDRESLTISATRDGLESTISVVDSVNAVLVSERAEDLVDYSLGALAAGEHTLTITVTSEAGNSKTYTVKLTVAEEEPETPDIPVVPDEPENINTLGSFTLSIGNRTLINGVDESQTVSAPIAYNDRGRIKLTAVRDGEKSTVKVVDGKMVGNSVKSERTVVGNREADLSEVSLGTLDVGKHMITVTVTSEAGNARRYSVILMVSVENTKIVLTATPSMLSKSNPYREFTVTARIENVSSVDGGIYAGAVLITPEQSGILEFVGFVPSSEVVQSALLIGSLDKEGINVLMEGGNNGASAITEDFNVGSFKFRLKNSITTVPDSITFNYEDKGCTSFLGSVLYLESGTLTVTFSDEPETPIAKPVATVTENGYNGSVQDYTPAGMETLVSEGKVKLYVETSAGVESEVSLDAFKQLNAGSYKVVARPSDGYCWEGVSDSAAQTYSFTVNKAPITAIPAEEGELPIFRSDSYQGSLEDVVTYKYYSDEACTQEVNPSQLVAGNSYFLKATLKDGAEANFAFDPGEVTQIYVSNGFAYKPVAETGLSTGAIVGISVGAAAALGAIGFIIMILLKKKKNDKDKAGAAKA